MRWLTQFIKKGDMILFGIDMRKNAYTIEQAYRNPYEEPFVMNYFERINRELEGTFNMKNFYYYTCYCPFESKNTNYIISSCDQTVKIRDK